MKTIISTPTQSGPSLGVGIIGSLLAQVQYVARCADGLTCFGEQQLNQLRGQERRLSVATLTSSTPLTPMVSKAFTPLVSPFALTCPCEISLPSGWLIGKFQLSGALLVVSNTQVYANYGRHKGTLRPLSRSLITGVSLHA